jgi:eukaryotic-like serine/threonine-protein kinase
MNIRTIIGDRYRVVRTHAVGGCGAVFVAHDMKEEVEVAIKVQPERTFESSRFFAEYGETFAGEAQNLRLLSGIRGIPECRGTGTYENRRYVVMDFVNGMTLGEFVVNPGAQRSAVAASVLGQLCEILHLVHSRDLVHRDIKPENIMVQPDGEIRLIDMGFALPIGSVPEFPCGTKGFAAPEQYLPEVPAAVVGDIFSLGCVLFEMIAGMLPYGGNARNAITGAEVLPLDRLGGLHPDLAELGLAMVAVDPAERPADVLEILRRLKPVLPAPGSMRDFKVRRPDVTEWYRKGRGMPLCSL